MTYYSLPSLLIVPLLSPPKILKYLKVPPEEKSGTVPNSNIVKMVALSLKQLHINHGMWNIWSVQKQKLNVHKDTQNDS